MLGPSGRMVGASVITRQRRARTMHLGDNGSGLQITVLVTDMTIPQGRSSSVEIEIYPMPLGIGALDLSGDLPSWDQIIDEALALTSPVKDSWVYRAIEASRLQKRDEQLAEARHLLDDFPETVETLSHGLATYGYANGTTITQGINSDWVTADKMITDADLYLIVTDVAGRQYQYRQTPKTRSQLLGKQKVTPGLPEALQPMSRDAMYRLNEADLGGLNTMIRNALDSGPSPEPPISTETIT